VVSANSKSMIPACLSLDIESPFKPTCVCAHLDAAPKAWVSRARAAADEDKLTGHAKCSVPLTAIKVDSDDIKTEHFQQWATNKKSDPKKCTFDLDVPSVTLPSALQEKQPVSFSTEGTFTICGRKREGGQPEKIQGAIVLLPAGSLGDGKAYRIRAKVEGFNREQYSISPKATAGWLARVQQLANVVATDGTIDVNIFATGPGGDAIKSAMMQQR